MKNSNKKGLISKSTKFIVTTVVLSVCQLAVAVELDYYLDSPASYDQKISTPESSLGFQVGEWHARPEQIERYLERLAKQSDRIKLETIGYTHENRPLMLAYISSPQNITNLESIRQRHLQGAQSDSTPLVTWMGYSVHGNEASGSNASMLLAYHLVAATDQQTLTQLDNQIIIIDPMLNPDGLARFAHWVNMYRSKIPNADPNTMEHNEVWPQGRTNHYWFDLNRDWLLLQHPESVARVTQFHRWRPNILTDFHEMGTDSSYFFQPGVQTRQNPLTPASNYKMTATIAESHAKALDGIGSLFYSKENFDDFYYGKGSTYPDVHGTVGILFEQASARGHRQNSNDGQIDFPFAIRNHLTTSLSTIAAAQQNRSQLKSMQQDFIKQTERLAKADKQRAIVFKSHDSYRVNELKRILDGHQIQYHPLSNNLKVDKQLFGKSGAWIIPLQQPQYRLIKSLFERRKSFADNVFYDVSAWNIGLALDLDFGYVERGDYKNSLLGKAQPPQDIRSIVNSKAIALAFDWNNFNSARLLSEMQQFGLRVQGVTRPITIRNGEGTHALPLGSLVLPLTNQTGDPQLGFSRSASNMALSRQSILNWLAPKLKSLNVEAIEISSGLALKGVDLGSPSLAILNKINPLLIVGEDTSSYDAGEIWHLLDQRISQPLTMLTQQQLKKLARLDYTHMILVNGTYEFDEATITKIEQWVKQGGIIIAHSKGAEWLLSQGWSSSEIKPFDKNEQTQLTYADKAQIDAKDIIGGAIAYAEIDITHPLAFGLDNSALAIFKRGQQVFTEPKEAFVSVARFTEQPHAAGYLSEKNRLHIGQGTSIMVQGLGKGKLIAFSDNPAFRGFWLGTSRVLVNALYYGDSIQAPEKTKQDDQKESVKSKTNEKEANKVPAG